MTFAVPDSPVDEYDPVHEPRKGDVVDPVPLPPQPASPTSAIAVVGMRMKCRRKSEAIDAKQTCLVKVLVLVFINHVVGSRSATNRSCYEGSVK